MRHPATAVGTDCSGGGGGGWGASSTAAVSVERSLPGEDYSAVLEEDGSFALDADCAGGVKLLQELETGSLARRCFGGHEAANEVGGMILTEVANQFGEASSEAYIPLVGQEQPFRQEWVPQAPH